jgi:hypothetical protein
MAFSLRPTLIKPESMEAANHQNNFKSGATLQEVISTFFKSNTPDSVNFLFWRLFQCWALKDCKIKAEVSDEEVALFFDQLIDLVAAAHIVHQANRASTNLQKGTDHAS